MKQMLTDMGMGNVEVYGKGDAENLIPLIKNSAMNGEARIAACNKTDMRDLRSRAEGAGYEVLPAESLVWGTGMQKILALDDSRLISHLQGAPEIRTYQDAVGFGRIFRLKPAVISELKKPVNEDLRPGILGKDLSESRTHIDSNGMTNTIYNILSNNKEKFKNLESPNWKTSLSGRIGEEYCKIIVEKSGFRILSSQVNNPTFSEHQKSTNVDIVARAERNFVQNNIYIRKGETVFFEVKMGKENYLLNQVTGKEHLQAQLAAGPISGTKHFVLCSSDLKGSLEKEIRGSLEKSQMLVVLPKKEVFDFHVANAVTKVRQQSSLA